MFPLPADKSPPVEKEEAVTEVKETPGTFEIQHAKLRPGWRQASHPHPFIAFSSLLSSLLLSSLGSLIQTHPTLLNLPLFTRTYSFTHTPSLP